MKTKFLKSNLSTVSLIVLIFLTTSSWINKTQAQTKKPNMLVIWGDDIGISNISHNNRGLMGYMTPNIDRVAQEGIAFTDYYGQQSCTAGRAAFTGGSVPVRSGMTKVGMPGAKEGWQETDLTMATVLKSQGYVTGQFGKNHEGDLDEHLPTNHGFDEFFGNLYHLNAEEEPENMDYPADLVLKDGSTFKEKYGPRGVIHSWADGKGGQRIEDTGPLTKKRMETVDNKTIKETKKIITVAVKSGEPFFVWWNGTRMHFRTHVKEELRGISGQDEYGDGRVEHDMKVGELLDLMDELGIADNTVVMYSTDNGPHFNTWPDAATNSFHGEKKGVTLGGRSYKNHIGGVNQLDYKKGNVKESPREGFIYVNDAGSIAALRYGDWKAMFQVNRADQLQIWLEPFVELRAPYLFNLRRDPFE